MKKLGLAENEQTIVLLTKNEFEALSMLCAIVNGKHPVNRFTNWSGPRQFEGANIEKVLLSVIEFATNQDLLREAIEGLESIKASWDEGGCDSDE